MESTNKQPLITFLINAEGKNAKTALASLSEQTSKDFEVLVFGDSYAYMDQGIQSMGDMSPCDAFSNIHGSFVAYLEATDVLHRDAIKIFAKHVKDFPGCGAFYSDSQQECGGVLAPVNKPDFSPDLLLSYNYIGRPFFVSRRVYKEAGGLCNFSPEECYRFTLFACNSAENITHIDEVLLTAKSKKTNVSYEQIKGVYSELLKENHTDGFAVRGLYEGGFRIHYTISKKYRTKIVYTNVSDADSLRDTLELCDDITNDNYSITIAASETDDLKLKRYLTALSNSKAAEIKYFSADDSFSYRMNICAGGGKCNAYIFCNCTVSPQNPDWIEAMHELSQRKNTGTVSPLILSADNRIAEAGNVVGLQGWWGTPFCGEIRNYCGDEMNEFINSIRNVTLSGFNCFMISDDAFNAVRGFDTSFVGRAAIADLCIRLMQKGFLNVYTPFSCMKGGQESFTQPDKEDEERAYSVLRRTLLHGDMFFSNAYDPKYLTPTTADVKYIPAKLNPLYTGR